MLHYYYICFTVVLVVALVLQFEVDAAFEQFNGGAHAGFHFAPRAH